MPGRIVLLGATGYTGRLVTADLVEIGERPLIAGRDRAKLDELSRQNGGLESAVADVSDPGSVSKLVGEGDVLISTVGPFTLYGEPAIQAALSAGAHYLDSTGESVFVRGIFSDAGPVAEKKSATLLTAFGYDYVPGNVAAAVAVSRAGDKASRVDVGYLLPPSMHLGRGQPVISTGTRASMLAIVAAPQHSLRAGRLTLEPTGKRVQGFRVSGKERFGTSIGGTEPIALPTTFPQLRDVGVYMELPGPPKVTQAVALGVAVALVTVSHIGSGKRMIDDLVRSAAKKTGGGPSAEARSKSGSLVVATCSDSDGNVLSGVKVEGPVNGYTLTGKLLAWGAASLRAGRQKAFGAQGPVGAFGLDECVAAFESFGLTISDLSG